MPEPSLLACTKFYVDEDSATEALEGHLLLMTYFLQLITYLFLLISYYLFVITYNLEISSSSNRKSGGFSSRKVVVVEIVVESPSIIETGNSVPLNRK